MCGKQDPYGGNTLRVLHGADAQRMPRLGRAELQQLLGNRLTEKRGENPARVRVSEGDGEALEDGPRWNAREKRNPVSQPRPHTD